MNKYLLVIAALFLATGLSAQTPTNLDLENWTDFGQYMEPDGEWTTANKIVLLSPFNPVTTTQSSDAHTGQWAAKVETSSIQIINTLVTGTLALGEFDQGALPPNNLRQGTPYNDRPSRFRGWYKFTSVNSDSCTIYMWLFKFNAGLGVRDTIGIAQMVTSTSVNAYTQFDLPMVYNSMDIPDSMSIVVASSAEGANFQGQVGNTVWVDDFEIVSSTGLVQVMMPEFQVTAYPNPTTDLIRFSWERDLEAAQIEIYSLDGKLVKTVPVNGRQAEAPTSELAAGTYHYLLKDKSTSLFSGSFIAQ